MLDLEITRRCNLRCGTCYVLAGRGPAADLEPETAFAVIDEAYPFFPHVLHITGGEPFLHPGLHRIIDHGLRTGYPRVAVNTNGHFLDTSMMERLTPFRDRLSLTVSLDGGRSDHDAVRGDDSHATVTAGIGRWLEAGFRVGLFTVVTRRLLPRLPDFLADHFRRFPDAPVSLVPVGDVTRGEAGALTEPLGARALVLLGMLVASLIHGGRPVRVVDYPVVNLVLLKFGVPPERMFHCTGGHRRICVQADLTVTPCHPVSHPLGRYTPGALAGIVENGDCRRFRLKEYDGCADCEYRPICGHCRAFVLGQGLGPFGNDRICDEVRSILGMREEGKGKREATA